MRAAIPGAEMQRVPKRWLHFPRAASTDHLRAFLHRAIAKKSANLTKR
jgi:hypothetical protein